jgi:hypothetical protein
MSNKRAKNMKNWAAIRRKSRHVEAQRQHAGFSLPSKQSLSPMPTINGGGTIDANGIADIGVRVSSGNALGLHDIKVIGARQAGVQIERDAQVHATRLDVSNNKAGIDNAGTFYGPDTVFE